MISATLTTNRYKGAAFLVVFLLLLTLAGTKTVSALTIEKTTDFLATDLTHDVSAFSLDSQIAIRIKTNSFYNPIQVKIRQLELSDFNIPSGWQVSSEVYSYDILTEISPIKGASFDLYMNLTTPTPQVKRIFVYNYDKSIFEEQPSDIESANLVRTNFSKLAGTIVVLSDVSILEYGDASWYAYKNCDCAASTYYPKGTMLLVKNLENGKEVIVKVNDYGPIRAIFPERVIDLDKVAFAKLGNIRAGILKKIVVTKIK